MNLYMTTSKQIIDPSHNIQSSCIHVCDRINIRAVTSNTLQGYWDRTH